MEGGVAAKCWRPPIFPAWWLKKVANANRAQKKVCVFRAGNENKIRKQIQYGEKQLPVYLNSLIYAPK